MGSFAEKPGVKLNPSPLDAHTPWLLALVANEPDLTLAEIRARLLEERQVQTGGSSVCWFFNRHGISFKKIVHASEQNRADVAKAREEWREGQSSQAQGKTEIEPNGVCDDLGRKSVTFVTDGTKDHAPVNIIRAHPIELT